MKAEGKKREGNRLKVTEWGTFTAFNPRPCLWKHSVEKQRGWLLTSSKHAIRPLAPKNRATSSYRAGETRQPWSAAIKVSLSSFDGSLYRLSNITYISFLWRLFELSNRRNVCTSLVLITFVLLQKTGARIKIYSHCCPHSTDRLISICGKPTTCIECIRELIATIKTVSVLIGIKIVRNYRQRFYIYKKKDEEYTYIIQEET